MLRKPVSAIRYGLMEPLGNAVLGHIRKHGLVQAGDRVVVAVSGGADSVALLCLLLELRAELGVILSVAHFNHKLRGAEADADERFVAALAYQHGLPFYCEGLDVRLLAKADQLSIEAAARKARYEFFQQLLNKNKADRVATAHTLDDQAETVLLKLARGAGTRGIAGIYPEVPIAVMPSLPGNARRQPAIVRPLLTVRRLQLLPYLQNLGQEWREDRSNRDLRYARNRVRHGVLPRLERSLNPAVREALAATAEVAWAEESYWQSVVNQALSSLLVSRPALSGGHLEYHIDFASVRNLPLALQRRLVRAFAGLIGIRLEFHHVEEVLALTPGASASLPHDHTARLANHELTIRPADLRRHEHPGYEYLLSLPGRTMVTEIGMGLEVLLVPPAERERYNPDDFLDASRLASSLRVRNWRAGDRYWPAHTKAPKKIKELLQERHVSGAERRLWPVVVSGDDVVWVRGFRAPSWLRPRDGCQTAVLIRETSPGREES